MHKQFFKYLLLFTIILTCGISSHAQENWELKKNKNGIKVYTNEIEGSDFKTFRAEVQLDASIHAFVALLLDVDDLPEWAYSVKYAKILERSGDTVQIYYSEASVPFPFRDRDGIYLNRFRWIADSNRLFVEIELLHNYLEVKDKLVRVNGKGFWSVQVIEDNKLNVTFQMQVDPGGNIPTWLVNIFVDDTPYNSMVKMREFIKKEKYQNQRFLFLD